MLKHIQYCGFALSSPVQNGVLVRTLALDGVVGWGTSRLKGYRKAMCTRFTFYLEEWLQRRGDFGDRGV